MAVCVFVHKSSTHVYLYAHLFTRIFTRMKLFRVLPLGSRKRGYFPYLLTACHQLSTNLEKYRNLSMFCRAIFLEVKFEGMRNEG